MTGPIYDFSLNLIDGTGTKLSAYAGKVMLIVNVASKCGLTPQYEGLESLYASYRDRGLVVLGFPCNDFGEQEPGSEAAIQEFCRSIYGVDFPMFTKLHVKGNEQSPLYAALTEAQPVRTLPEPANPKVAARRNEKDVRWNFEKFLVSRAGEVVGRFDPDVVPLDPILTDAVEKELGPAA